MRFNADKFRKNKANERSRTFSTAREFNAVFANFAALKLNFVQAVIGYEPLARKGEALSVVLSSAPNKNKTNLDEKSKFVLFYLWAKDLMTFTKIF